MKYASGNSRQAFAGLKRLSTCLQFNRKPPGESRPFGRVLAEEVADVIQHRTVISQEEPDNSPLAALRPRTLRIKAKLGQPETISIATGEMMAPENVVGEVKIGTHAMTQTAGVTPEAKFHTSEFSSGGEGLYAARPYYEMGPDGEWIADVVIKKVLDDTTEEVSW